MKFIVGVDNFGEAVEQKFDFIDKTLLVKEILDNAATKATVITRPRRFGKTFNMSMLRHFFASDVKGLKTKHLFDNLKIAACGPAYMSEQGKYPVIFITFKGVSDGSFAHAFDKLQILMRDTYDAHRYLLDSDKLSAHHKKLFEAILYEEVTDQSKLANSLSLLSTLLHQHHSVKPWLLIDEYDSPIQSAYFHGYYDEMIQFMRDMFGSVLKGNDDIHRAVITGILRISKESLFSGVNNLMVYTILNEEYAEHFGFTESEVETVFKKANLETSLNDVRAWYNGYRIGNLQIYNPWSIAVCVSSKGVTRPYWVNTSSNDLIKTVMAAADAPIKDQLELILAGKPIPTIVTDSLVFTDLTKNSDALWSLLLFSGYLTLVEKKFSGTGTRVECLLKTPNQEIAALYQDIILEWFDASLGYTGYKNFLGYLTSGKLVEFLKVLQQFLKESTSHFDTQGRHPEKFYHGFVLGLMASLRDTHIIRSNKESGYGRYDVMLIPKDLQQLGLILEFKVADDDVPLADEAQEALAQINARAYETEMKQSGVQRIVKIGLASRNKEVAMAHE